MALGNGKSNTESIYELLAKQGSKATFEIAKELKLELDAVYVAISRLRKYSLIEHCDNKRKEGAKRNSKVYRVKRTSKKKDYGNGISIYIKYLDFLMSFFQRNDKLLQESDRDYILENIDVFRAINKTIIENQDEINGIQLFRD